MKKSMIVLMLCAVALTGPVMGADAVAIARQKQCFVCHDATLTWMIGPPFRDIAKRYREVSSARTMLAEVIESGTEGHWAASKMPAQSRRAPLTAEEAEVLAAYVLSFE